MEIDKKLIFIIILGCISLSLSSQNLIPNPSFEERKERKRYNGRIKPLYFWFSPNKGTPDMLSEKCIRNYQQPRNQFGNQEPQDGEIYVGIGYEPVINLYEYLSVKLKDSLHQGKCYLLEFYTSLTDNSKIGMNALSVAFSKEKPKADGGKYCYFFPTGKIIFDDEIVLEKEKWILKSYYFLAEGGEEYFTIGNFRKFENTRMLYARSGKECKLIRTDLATGYYIDNVSLIEIRDSSECPCYTKPLLAVNDSVTDIVMEEKDSVVHFILENIYFETDKAILLDSSYKELDAMFEILSTNNSNKIIIAGHTDNQGDEKHNQQLSEARAKAVYSYFIEKGIAASRMEYIGYGSTNPISDNNTEEGRRKNRRVEILIE